MRENTYAGNFTFSVGLKNGSFPGFLGEFFHSGSLYWANRAAAKALRRALQTYIDRNALRLRAL